MRLSAGAQDGIKLRLISPHFVFPSSIQFLLPRQTQTFLEKRLLLTFHEHYNTGATYLSILFGQGDVNSPSFVPISLDRVRHVVLIKHTVHASFQEVCFERAHQV